MSSSIKFNFCVKNVRINAYTSDYNTSSLEIPPYKSWVASHSRSDCGKTICTSNISGIKFMPTSHTFSDIGHIEITVSTKVYYLHCRKNSITLLHVHTVTNQSVRWSCYNWMHMVESAKDLLSLINMITTN